MMALLSPPDPSIFRPLESTSDREILSHGEVGESGVLLMHDPNSGLPRLGRGDRACVVSLFSEPYLTGIGPLDTRENLDQRRLSRPVCADRRVIAPGPTSKEASRRAWLAP